MIHFMCKYLGLEHWDQCFHPQVKYLVIILSIHMKNGCRIACHVYITGPV